MESNPSIPGVIMFNGFYPNMSDDDDEVCSTSSNEDLWAEVQRLRKAAEAATKRSDQILEARAAEGKAVLILGGDVTYEAMQEIAAAWSKLVKNGACWCIPKDVTVSELSDADLAQLGLKRVASNGPATERDIYDSMLKGY